MNLVTRRVNTYFAILLVTIFGSGATLIIVHVATDSALAHTLAPSELSTISNGRP